MITSETDRISYTGNGSTKLFTFPFKIIEDDDILVVKKLTSTGAETTLILNTDYTVSGAGDSTGSITTLAASAIASTYTIHIIRNVEFTQEADYVEGDAFPAETHETILDKLTILAQQLKSMAYRAIKFPVTENNNQVIGTMAERAGKGLGFDADGNLGLINTDTYAATPVSTLLTQENTFTEKQTFSKAIIQKAGANIASATITDLSTATGNSITITGTTTITGFGIIQGGAIINVIFASVLILTHNPTSLILPGAANITTVAGDVATFLSLSNGNWQCINYQSSIFVGNIFTNSATGNILTLAKTGSNPERWNINSINTADVGSVPTLKIGTTNTGTDLNLYLPATAGGMRLWLWNNSLIPDLPHTAIKPTFAVYGDILCGDIITIESNPMTIFMRQDAGLPVTATTQIFCARAMNSDTNGGAGIVLAPFTGGSGVNDGYMQLNVFGSGTGTVSNTFVFQARVSVNTIEEVARIKGRNNMTTGMTALALLCYDGSTWTEKDVEMGVQDSGGTGYRLLRVANF